MNGFKKKILIFILLIAFPLFAWEKITEQSVFEVYGDGT